MYSAVKSESHDAVEENVLFQMEVVFGCLAFCHSGCFFALKVTCSSLIEAWSCGDDEKSY